MRGVFLNQHFPSFSHPVLLQYNNFKRNLKIWEVVHVVNMAGVLMLTWKMSDSLAHG